MLDFLSDLKQDGLVLRISYESSPQIYAEVENIFNQKN